MKTMITKNWRHLLIVSLTSALFALASVASATYYGYIVERSHNKDVTLFFMMIVAGLTVVLLRYMFDVINQTLMVKFVGSIVSAFRQKTMARITANQVSDFGQNKVSAYTSNLLNDVELLEINLVEPFFDLLSQVIIVIISSAVILYYQPTVFLIILLGSTLVFLIPTLMSQKLQEKQSALSEQSEHLTASVTDILNGFATVKATQTLPHFLKDFQKTNHNYTQAKISSGQWIMSNYATSGMLGMFVQYAAVLAAIWFIMQGTMSIGVMLTMVQTMNTLVYPLIDIFRLIPQIKSTRPILQKIENLAQRPVPSQTALPTLAFNQRLTLSHVSVTLNDKTILDDISLTLIKNKKYLIIGPSGSGKSTLANILAGFISDFKGDMRVDEQVVTTSDQMFDLVAYVNQSPYLFNTTVLQNIVMYKKIDDAKLAQVLQESGVKQFLTHDSQLAEDITSNGTNYSGGERQRIAIARGLYQQKPLLVLDESLSGLNSSLAHDIENSLLNHNDLTLLYITHKFDMALLKKYDEIIWIQDGKLYQMASPDVMLFNQEFLSFLNITGKYNRPVSD